MNKDNWIDQITSLDIDHPGEDVLNEEVYTLKMKDFLVMPEIQFTELVDLDPQLKVLLN